MPVSSNIASCYIISASPSRTTCSTAGGVASRSASMERITEGGGEMNSSQKPTPCLACGALAVSTTRDPLTVDFRDGRFIVDGFEYERCGACGEEYYQAGQVDAIHARAAEQARQARGLLMPDDICQLRLDLGLTQMALDGALGASPGTVGRWERGSIVQPAVADRLMRLLWTHPDLLVEVVQPVAREARGPYRPRSGKRDIE